MYKYYLLTYLLTYIICCRIHVGLQLVAGKPAQNHSVLRESIVLLVHG